MAKKAKTDARHDADAKKHVEREVEGGAAGAIAGAAVGALAGPVGVAAGAVIGAVAGAIAGGALDQDAKATADEEEELDDEIGVSGGELGAPNLKHPPAKVGAYSAASSGGASPAEDDVAEGPMQAPK